MVTGLVIFLCFVFCFLMLYIGYLSGVKFATETQVRAWIEAMEDYGLDYVAISKIINHTQELVGKKIKG